MSLYNIDDFLSTYDEWVIFNAFKIRALLLENLPNIIEKIDLPAKMIAYSYGSNYTELICVLILSTKGLKLGFNRGVDLPDPKHLLRGTRKISRYVEIQNENDNDALENLIKSALEAYHIRTKL